jgi:lysophospholipase L1-like esterase
MLSMVAAALVLAGCGNEPAAAPTARVDVAALGDSITEGTHVDPSERWDAYAAKRTGLRFRNCGIFGQRTDEIAARLGACAKGARILIVQGGINDIAQGRPIEDAAKDLRAMVRRGKALKLDVRLTDVLPWNSGYPSAAQPIRDLNAMIARIGREEHVPVLPFFATLEDPDAPDRMKPEWTVDGDHPSPAGHRLLAELIRP